MFNTSDRIVPVNTIYQNTILQKAWASFRNSFRSLSSPSIPVKHGKHIGQFDSRTVKNHLALEIAPAAVELGIHRKN